MSHAERLLALMQSLRQRRAPVAAAALAAEFGVSERTVYRDIAVLTRRGATIDGAPGLGYVLRPGLFLPPLMLDGPEADAVMLGLRLVAHRGDATLAAAARAAAAKVEAILPEAVARRVRLNGLVAMPDAGTDPGTVAILRTAMQAERKLRLAYRDGAGQRTDRVVWPVALGFAEDAEVLAAWCETRSAFRHFRLDRILALAPSRDRLPRPRRTLLAEWRAVETAVEF